MPPNDKPSRHGLGAEQLTKLADTLGVDIKPETLASMAAHLNRLDDLDAAQLGDTAPALKMDAAWHD